MINKRKTRITALTTVLIAVAGLIYLVTTRHGSLVHSTPDGGGGGGVGGDGKHVLLAGQNGEKRPGKEEACVGVNTREIVSWKRGQVMELQPKIAKNCEKLKLGVPQEQARVRLALSSWRPRESEPEFLERMTQCPQVWEEFSDRNFYNSAEEQSFPIAYVLVFHNNTRQILRLLKVLWRPQNVFCLHLDAKQGHKFVTFFREFASCFDNLFVASKLEKVIYAHHTIMDAQLNCMGDLLAMNESKWKYIVTLCGTELPLKTNREIVRGLKGLKGGTGITTHAMDDNSNSRFDRKIAIGPNNEIRFTNERLDDPPHGIELRKSWDFFALTRPFVKFILTDRRAIDFRNYCRGVYIPEEHFFASLFWMRDAPDGEFRRDKTGIIPLVSDMVWVEDSKHTARCAGNVVHGICILSSGDLQTVYTKGVLSHTNRFFYNKYFMHLDHVVMDCMEERLVLQNKLEYIRDCLT